MWLIGKTVNWAEAGKATCPTVGRIIGMAKDKVSITLDRDVLAAADADAKAAGLNRSELVEQALRHEHLRIALKSYTTTTVPILNIDDYAQKIFPSL